MANPELDAGFVEQQKRRLEETREELRRIVRGMREDVKERSEEYQDDQPDSGDESQFVFQRELDATIEQGTEQRLKAVERALEKIEEGTYGLSDESGEPIPRGRLEALPEALRTVEEQQRFEGGRRPPV